MTKTTAAAPLPFLDLAAQYRSIRAEIDEAIAAVISETAFIGGPYLGRFEKEFAAYCGSAEAVGVSNGTDALRLALLACGVGPGDEVLTVPNTFIATAEAVTMVGARVRFIDIDPDTNTMDSKLLEAGCTDRTKAIIPVHLYGKSADLDAIGAFAKRRGLKVIGDAAQAHGAVYKGRPISTLADATCFSFYPGKNLGAYGDAGAVVTDDPAVAKSVRMLRDHGRTTKYEHDMEGFNCRMDGLQAAILSVKLRHLKNWTQRRQTLAALYTQALSGVSDLILPSDFADNRSVFHLYVVHTAKRKELQAHLQSRGIGCGIHYPIPLHLQRAYAYLKLGAGSFPHAERQCAMALSLPLYPEMTEEQVRYVAGEVAVCLSRESSPRAGQ